MKTLRESIKEIQVSHQDLGGCLIITRTEKSSTFFNFYYHWDFPVFDFWLNHLKISRKTLEKFLDYKVFPSNHKPKD